VPSGIAQEGSAESELGDFQVGFKFVLVGESGVGKRAICKRFCEHMFVNDGPPAFGLEFGARIVQVSDTRIKLHIWDAAGWERLHSITRSYFRASAAVFLVYDVTRRESLSKLGVWLENAVQLAPRTAVKVLIGNTTASDAQRTVPTNEAQDFADQNSLRFLENRRCPVAGSTTQRHRSGRPSSTRHRRRRNRRVRPRIAAPLALVINLLSTGVPCGRWSVPSASIILRAANWSDALRFRAIGIRTGTIASFMGGA
jgi:hypothetical protein